MQYRPDIDGLRAVAVLPVVLFHADVAGLSGGYVGVDIFFVISGFLITTIIHREIGDGRFSILRFYERRARRILPALFTVICATLLASFYLSMPAEFIDTARSAVATVLFVSNFLFWSETGYFSPGIFSQPLLHTWSLAIEEQFYIFFPPLMLLLALLRLPVRAVIGVLTLLSLGLSAATTAMRPEMAYFLLPWRAWELGIGAFVALSMASIRIKRPLRDVFSAAGLIAIIVAVTTFDESTVFPGAAALLPVGGAAVIIACGPQGDTLVARFLSMRVMVWVGLISYSLYLWHWPVIVFYQQLTFARPDGLGVVTVVGLSMALAWASWAWVEAPFRSGRGPRLRLSRAGIFGLSGLGMAGIAALSLGVVLGQGLPGRLPPDAVRLAAFAEDQHPLLRACTGRFEQWRDPADPCIFGPGDGHPTAAIWGDSHAAALMPEIEAAADRSARRIAYLSRAGCLPVRNTERMDGRNGGCAAYGNGAMDYLLSQPNIDTVLIVARYALAAEGYLLDYGLSERGFGPTLFADTATGPWDEEHRADELMQRIDDTVTVLKGAGKQVVVIYPIPEIGHKVPETLARLSLQGRPVAGFGLPRAAYDARNQPLIAQLDAIAARTGALTIRPDAVLCDTVLCRAYGDGAALYYDDDHLSSVGAALLGPQIDRALQATAQHAKASATGGQL